MGWSPDELLSCLCPVGLTVGWEVRYSLGDPLVDSYLEFVAGRCRPNTLRAVTLDLKVFVTVVTRDPVEVAAPDVFEYLAHQRGDRRWRRPLTLEGLDEIVAGAKHCAGLERCTCHQLRHTCLTQLREARIARSGPGPGRPPLFRVDQDLPAPHQRLARQRVSTRRATNRRHHRG